MKGSVGTALTHLYKPNVIQSCVVYHNLVGKPKG